MIRIFTLVALLAIGAGTVVADAISEQFNEGWYAYQDGDYDKAIRLWRPLADAGDKDTQYYLGELYRDGLKDPSAAISWFEKAAQQGFTKAMTSLGLAYADGWGVARDDAAAFEWFHKAALDGDAIGQAMLGWCFEYGRGTDPDIAKALSWYRLAAKQDHVMSQNALGRIYSEGTAVKLDEPRSCYWYDMAAEQGDGFAKYRVGYCYANGWGREADHELAIDYFRQAIDAGIAEAVAALESYALAEVASAQYALATVYGEGQLVDRDDGRAFSLARAAADQGHVDSLALVGSFYFEGLGVAPDQVRAEQALLQAALANNERAKSWLAQLYAARGDTNPEDLKKAWVWASLALTSDLDGTEPELAAIEFMFTAFEEDSLEMFTIQMETEAALNEAQLAEAERLFNKWGALFASGLPGVTLTHLRDLTPP